MAVRQAPGKSVLALALQVRRYAANIV